MRVLVIAASDPGASLFHLTTELRRQGRADARLVTLGNPAFARIPADVEQVHDGGGELIELLEQAEVIHLVDLVPEQVDLFGVGLVDRLQQSDTRLILQRDVAASADDSHRYEALRATHGAHLVETRPGLLPATCGAAFMPPVIPFWRGLWSPLLEGTQSRMSKNVKAVVYASSTRPFERRPGLEALLEDTEDAAARGNLRLETTLQRPLDWVLRRRRQAHLVLTDSDHGLARSALEGLAQGIDVVARLSSSDAAAYAALAGDEELPTTPAAALRTHLSTLGGPPRPRPQSVAWARRVLNPERWFAWLAAAWAAPATDAQPSPDVSAA